MWEERIVLDPKILVGKPVVKGTWLAVDFILDLLGQGWPSDEILRNYPGLEAEDIQACLAYARDMAAVQPRQPLRGLLADLGPAPSAEDIDEVQQEMWGTFAQE